MRQEQIICDVCGEIKLPTQVWIALTVKQAYLVIERDVATFANGEGERKDICSQMCLMKEVNKRLPLLRHASHAASNSHSET